jgi:choline dehydrogenase-like flavoprotein
MPNINAGNTNAPAMMLGSRCAAFIMGETTVPDFTSFAAPPGRWSAPASRQAEIGSAAIRP